MGRDIKFNTRMNAKDKVEVPRVRCEKCGASVFKNNLDNRGHCSFCRDMYSED